jgi:hypothetical protein
MRGVRTPVLTIRLAQRYLLAVYKQQNVLLLYGTSLTIGQILMEEGFEPLTSDTVF